MSVRGRAANPTTDGKYTGNRSLDGRQKGGFAGHSKSTRRYQVELMDRLTPSGMIARESSPINIRPYPLLTKPIFPVRCKLCHAPVCTCNFTVKKRLGSAKTSRTTEQSPERRSASKLPGERRRKTMEGQEDDLEDMICIRSSRDSSADIDSSAVFPKEEESSHVQLPSISLRTDAVRRPKLLKSVYVGRPATVFFDYPPQCMQPQRGCSRVVEMTDEEMARCPLLFRVSESVHTYNCFVNTYTYNGFGQTNGGGFNVLMGGPPRTDFVACLNQYQKTNHFPGAWQFGRKDNLWRNVYRMRRRFGREFEICPTTFILPDDFKRFEYERELDPKSYWIRKPVASSCGRGIKLISATAPVKKRQ